MNEIKTKERLVRDIATKRLETVYCKPNHQTVLKMMIEGQIFDTFVDMTTQEAFTLGRQGYSSVAIHAYIDESTKQYAGSFLSALMSKEPKDAILS